MAIDIKLAEPVKKHNQAGAWLPLLSFQKDKISSEDRMFFTERVGLLLETGSALLESLRAIEKQTDNPALAKMIKDLADDVETGKSFSQALGKHPEVFSSTYINLINASEHGGFMHKMLQQLLAMEEKLEKLRTIIQTAFIYPVFLMIFSTMVVFFIMLVVFPKFATLFASINDQLPFITLFLMALSEIIRQYWMLLIIALTMLLTGFLKWIRSSAGKEIIDNLKLKIPVVKDIMIKVYLIQFLRVMSLSLSNGVSVLDALKSCHDVIDNLIFRRFLNSMEKQVIEGQGIASGFEKAEIIPAMVRQMIRTGEESGNLTLVMERVADFYERKIEKNITILSKTIEPIMLLIMGVVIGLIVASIILPIFKLSAAFK